MCDFSHYCHYCHCCHYCLYFFLLYQYFWKEPRGVMASAVRASNNSLASSDNLARWKKIVYPKCPLCSISPCMLGHLPSNCQQALDQYEWRHNNILKYIHTTASSQGMGAHTDLEGCRVNGVTIPVGITITGLKHELVTINRNSNLQEITLVGSLVGVFQRTRKC